MNGGVQLHGTYGASVPEDDRARPERAETTREGSSRYSMASVPSRRGSGLDVVSLRGRFVAGAFHVGYATRVIHESKSERERAVIIIRSIDRGIECFTGADRRSADISPVFKCDRLTLIGRE